jgi:hypothetical protein
MKFIISEEERKSIRSMYLMEEYEDTNPELQFSELSGKTATFKDDELDVIVKGELRDMFPMQGHDAIIIHFNYLDVTNKKEEYSVDMDTANVIYNCNTQTFYITIRQKYNPLRVKTFTCKGLSDILIQKSPCKTDFVMTDTNVPNNFA